MNDDADQSDRTAQATSYDAAAQDYVAPEDASAEEFDAELAARYRRLSLLTLDLAEEAGEAALCVKAQKNEDNNFSLVERNNQADPFEKRPARERADSLRLAAFAARAMTRAIWAHRVIERLRRGSVIEKLRGGKDARKTSRATTASNAPTHEEAHASPHALTDLLSSNDPLASIPGALDGAFDEDASFNDNGDDGGRLFVSACRNGEVSKGRSWRAAKTASGKDRHRMWKHDDAAGAHAPAKKTEVVAGDAPDRCNGPVSSTVGSPAAKTTGAGHQRASPAMPP